MSPIIKYFLYQHLPEPLQKISKPFSELADFIEKTVNDEPEKTMALRKLLEAKDCAVRAAVTDDAAKGGLSSEYPP